MMLDPVWELRNCFIVLVFGPQDIAGNCTRRYQPIVARIVLMGRSGCFRELNLDAVFERNPILIFLTVIFLEDHRTFLKFHLASSFLRFHFASSFSVIPSA